MGQREDIGPQGDFMGAHGGTMGTHGNTWGSMGRKPTRHSLGPTRNPWRNYGDPWEAREDHMGPHGDPGGPMRSPQGPMVTCHGNPMGPAGARRGHHVRGVWGPLSSTSDGARGRGRASLDAISSEGTARVFLFPFRSRRVPLSPRADCEAPAALTGAGGECSRGRRVSLSPRADCEAPVDIEAISQAYFSMQRRPPRRSPHKKLRARVTPCSEQIALSRFDHWPLHRSARLSRTESLGLPRVSLALWMISN